MGTTYSVVQLVDIENFLATKKLNSQIGFKKLDIIRRKDSGKFEWFLGWLAYLRKSSGSRHWPMLACFHDRSCPRISYSGLYLVYA